MPYQKKLKESLPLLVSFGLLVIIGVTVLSFSRAGAALVTDDIGTPPGNVGTASETVTSTDTKTDDPETSAVTEVFNAELIEAPINLVNAAAFKDVYVETAEPGVYNHAYFEANQIVNARGTFNNDVFVAGETVTITGSVNGNVYAAGNTVTIDASVTGSVWVAGNTVIINGTVEQNVNAFGSTVTITENSYVGKDVMIGAANITIAGFVMGQVTGGGEQVNLSGHVHQHVTLDEVGTLTIGDTAWIGGNLTYTADTAINLPTGTLGGVIKFTQDNQTAGETDNAVEDKEATDDSDFNIGWFLIKLIIGLAGYLLLGFVLLKVWSKPMGAIAHTMLTKPGKSVGYGALYLLIAPPAIVMAALTFIGFPLAIVSGLVFLLSLIVGKIAVGLALGQKLLKNNTNSFAQFALAFSLLYVVFKVLCQGGIVVFGIASLVMFGLGAWALGAMMQHYKHKRHE